MTPEQLKAVRIIHAATRGHCRLEMLAGPSNAGIRAEIMSALTGRKTPRSAAGINAVAKELVTQLAIPPGCLAAQYDAICELCRSAAAHPAEQQDATDKATQAAGITVEMLARMINDNVLRTIQAPQYFVHSETLSKMQAQHESSETARRYIAEREADRDDLNSQLNTIETQVAFAAHVS